MEADGRWVRGIVAKGAKRYVVRMQQEEGRYSGNWHSCLLKPLRLLRTCLPVLHAQRGLPGRVFAGTNESTACARAMEDFAALHARGAGANDAMARVNGLSGHASRDGMDLFSGMMPPPFATKVERMRSYRRPALSFASISGPRDVSGTPDTAVSSASAFRLASMNRT